MVHTPSDDSWTESDKTELLRLARDSILHGLDVGQPLSASPSLESESLMRSRATFVTLNLNEQLRGCIGSLEAYRAIHEDVCENAFSAAFRDPRFSPVSRKELDQLRISISILSPPEKLDFLDEEDLLKKIRPGIDGLILEDGFSRGTFLPIVWEELPEPIDFWQHLKIKAGLRLSHWSPTLKVKRYTSSYFSEPDS